MLVESEETNYMCQSQTQPSIQKVAHLFVQLSMPTHAGKITFYGLGMISMTKKPKFKFLNVKTKIIHVAIIDWYVHNDADGIKHKILKYYPQNEVVNHMKKFWGVH